MRRFLSGPPVRLFSKQRTMPKDVAGLPEVLQREKMLAEFKLTKLSTLASDTMISNYLEADISEKKTKLLVDATLSTFLLHVEARIASSRGQGFYTIGPCGEETLGAIGLCLGESDASALHYRHVAAEVTRQLQSGVPLENILLDRARGYVCSTLDPVTGGKHCAIGGHEYSYMVTSTLSSQAPPAVGRALAFPLVKTLRVASKFSPKSVSFVTVGDGSINNAHFLSAVNLAQYAKHVKRKCPVVFGISDNGMCISLKGQQWVDSFVSNLSMKTFVVDATDVGDVVLKTEAALTYARQLSRPAAILYKNLRRRFGHAATDRQLAYLSPDEVEEAAGYSNLEPFFATAIQAGHVDLPYLANRMEEIINMVEVAFKTASNEPKIDDRSSLVSSNSRPVDFSNKSFEEAEVHALQIEKLVEYACSDEEDKKLSGKKAMGSSDVMRKHMTRCFDEQLEKNTNMMYIGEDVEHGGYYLVTDGLVRKYPGRVVDFPPDETSLVGAAIGFSQAGILTVLEIPYSKYLDCASDMFNEAVIANWLTNGRQPNGMVIRLQGFDKGIFGGNFHTHNMINIPPGLDVVCFSNGRDYVRGMRYAIRQAKAGRMVMSVDCTDLLNRRHFDPTGLRDSLFLTDYPENELDERSFDEVTVYTHDTGKKKGGSVAIVTYGNGVPTATQAVIEMLDTPALKKKFRSVSIVDCPYLSAPPQQLDDLLVSDQFDYVLFADICKEGPGMPFAGMAALLQKNGSLSIPWQAVGAQYTYNPLGNTMTFLNTEDIINGMNTLLDGSKKKSE